MWPEQFAALESDFIRSKARRKSADGYYRKLRNEGASPLDLSKARNDYLEKCEQHLAIEKRYWPALDFMDCQ